jgi:hypothetical protein
MPQESSWTSKPSRRSRQPSSYERNAEQNSDVRTKLQRDMDEIEKAHCRYTSSMRRQTILGMPLLFSEVNFYKVQCLK